MLEKEPTQSEASRQDELYEEVAASYGAPLGRLARAYEADPDKRRDLLQEIHIALWRSLENFGERCSLRTWVYRVAHNVATSHIVRQRRDNLRTFLSLDVLDSMAAAEDAERAANRPLGRSHVTHRRGRRDVRRRRAQRRALQAIRPSSR